MPTGSSAADFLSFLGHGEIDVDSGAATQGANRPCRQVGVKALSTNSGSVYVGNANTVTASDGTTDQTTGFELDAQHWSYFPARNLNELFFIADADNQIVCYILLGIQT